MLALSTFPTLVQTWEQGSGGDKPELRPFASFPPTATAFHPGYEKLLTDCQIALKTAVQSHPWAVTLLGIAMAKALEMLGIRSARLFLEVKVSSMLFGNFPC